MNGHRWLAPVALFAGVLAIGVAAFFSRPNPIYLGNETAHFGLLKSIVGFGDFQHVADYEQGDMNCDGETCVSNKPPGLALLVAPFYWPIAQLINGKSALYAYLAVKLASAIFTALAVVVVHLILRTYSVSWRESVLSMVAVFLATIYPAYAFLAQAMPLSTLLIFSTILFTRYALLGKAPDRNWAIAAFCTSYAVIVDFKNAVILAPFVFAFVLYGRRSARRYVYASISLLPIALLMVYNNAVFGSPMAITYNEVRPVPPMAPESLLELFTLWHIPIGLHGFLISESRGVLILSPIVVLGIWALIERSGAFHALHALIGTSLVLTLLVFSAYKYWHGGNSLGYRHILPVVMCALIPCGILMQRLDGLRLRLALALLFYSLVIGSLSFWIVAEKSVFGNVWKGMPDDVHKSFWGELIWPLFLTKPLLVALCAISASIVAIGLILLRAHRSDTRPTARTAG